MDLINCANPNEDAEDLWSTSLDFRLFTQKSFFLLSVESIMYLL